MSACNFPALTFSFALPVTIPGLPPIPDLAFLVPFPPFFCPLD